MFCSGAGSLRVTRRPPTQIRRLCYNSRNLLGGNNSMLSYETISDALLDSAEQAGLNVWQSDELIDPHSLQRTFTLTCLPLGQASPRPSSIQASIRFRWDSAMTAISTLGTEALCERYHGDNVACSHALVGCAYEATLALEVSYIVPIHMPVGNDM